MNDLTPVPGLEGICSATRDGKVFSHASNIFLTQKISRKGYYTIRINTNTCKLKLSVHRIIAATFLGMDLFDLSFEPHHKNIKTDNQVDNLEVLSKSDHEQLHSGISRVIDTKTHKQCCKCGKSKPRFEFHNCQRKNDGLNPRCKECVKETYIRSN